MTPPPGDDDVPKIKEHFEALFVDFFAGETGDLIVELRLTRETLAVGAKIPITVARRVPCETCKGTGRQEDAPACAECNGKGRIDTEVTETGGSPVTFLTTCKTCEGRGHAGEHTCKACERGYVKIEDAVEIEIPPGSAPGMQLRVPGKGHLRRDRPQGDVVAVLATAIEQQSAAASKAPSFMLFFIVFFIVLVVAVMMARS